MSSVFSGRRAAQALAVLLGVMVLGVAMSTVVLDALVHTPATGGPVVESLSLAAAAIPATSVGVLLAARRPRNPIGWLLLALLILGNTPTGQYAVLDYRMNHGTLPLGWAALVLGAGWPLFLVIIGILLWVFPDGQVPGGRWHRMSVALVTAGVLLALAASAPGVAAAVGHVVRVRADGSPAGPAGPWLVVQSVTIAVALASWLGWLGWQIPSYRRSAGERRQQLKWLYSGATVFLVAALLGVFIVPLALGDHAGSGPPIVNDLFNLGAAALPVCLGVAVLKYRLYAIDRIISRVISYAIITAVLAGVFAGLVVLATEVLPVRTPAAVAGATLVAAALFNPLRKRVQNAVDRRFNRARYDAEAIVAAFSGRLRQTIDLDAIRGDLVGVVHEAFQPAHVSVWLPRTGPRATVPALAPPDADQP